MAVYNDSGIFIIWFFSHKGAKIEENYILQIMHNVLKRFRKENYLLVA